ncbi:unnamed protein product [Dicrocoelium dendriticum]|nr:unnamed protein product [Dicrocoelium dendriticum]
MNRRAPFTMLQTLMMLAMASPNNNLEYRTKQTGTEVCTHLLSDSFARETFMRFLRTKNEALVHIELPLKVGMLELRNFNIQGLELTQLTGPIHVINLSKRILRMRVTLAFDNLQVEGETKMRSSLFKAQRMRATVRPGEVFAELDFRRAETSPPLELFDEPICKLHKLQITRWNGIRISGSGVVIKMFRLLNGENLFNGIIMRHVEKIIREQVHRKLQQLRPSNLVRLLDVKQPFFS